MSNKIITIDGPVASGKSSLAKELAKRLGYIHVSSGYFYRALGYILINECGKTITDLRVLALQDLNCIDPNQVNYECKQGEPCIKYNGIEITSFLKTRDIDDAASIISAYPFVRAMVNHFQNLMAHNNDIVIDGRDIGTVVFPQADTKIFLTASPERRARRWQRDQAAQGKQYTFEQSLQEVNERDRRDTQRKIAPLRVPEGAVIIDNTNQTLEQSIDEVLQRCCVQK